MNNDALVAALGMDAVVAVHGYRLHVIDEAERRGLRLVSAALPEVVQTFADAHIVDPIDIRLTFRHSRAPDLGGRILRWGPARGWSISRTGASDHPPFIYYAGSDATPLDLVPTAADVLDWAAKDAAGSAGESRPPPRGVELDDDPTAIQRLLSFIGPQRRRWASAASSPTNRQRAPGGHVRRHRTPGEPLTSQV